MKESLKLLNHINSFRFEQECGELKKFTSAQKETLNKLARTLARIISKY